MRDTKAVEGYKVAKSLTLPASRGMKFELRKGVAIVFHRYNGRNDSFTIEGTDDVSPEWAIGTMYVKEILSRDDFARFAKEFGLSA